MAILDAPTFAFDQRLFNLFNPSGRPDSDFANYYDLIPDYLGLAYTPDGVGGAGQYRYWNFLGQVPPHPEGIGYGETIDLVGIWVDPSTIDFSSLTNTSSNPNDDQMLWRLTGGGRNIFEFSAAAATANNADDTLFLAYALILDDTFNLSGLNDYAIGFGGNDTMNGVAGNDSLMGHVGADMLSGGTGNDVFIYTEASHSTLSSMDTITDYERGDAIELRGSQGLSSAVVSYQGTVADTISFISSTKPTNTVYFFTDGAVLNPAWYTYVKGAGTGGVSFDGTLIKINSNDTTAPFVIGVPVLTSAASYTLTSAQQDLTFVGNGTFVGTGNALDNKIIGGIGNDALYGLEGDDTLDGGVGGDTMEGGLGNDTYIVSVFNTFADYDTIVELPDQGIDEILIANDSYQLPDNVEYLTLVENTRQFLVSLHGNSLNNRITGANNALVEDYLNGGDGDDTLYGQDGVDWLAGGAGNDFLVGGEGDDLFEPNSGSDYILGGNGNDTISYTSGQHRIVGGNGVDTLRFSQIEYATFVSVDLYKSESWVYDLSQGISTQLSTVIEVENLTGTLGADFYFYG
jgi:Ca2+-binding RTX toxin-like protein